MDLKLQPASLDIWDKKYRLKTKEGEPVDEDIHATHVRIAKALASVEEPEKQKEWEEKFLDCLTNGGAIPAGRIVSNAGAGEYKPATSLINCVVSGKISDSMTSIFDKLHEAAITLKFGSGIGYSFSELRPKGAMVAGAGAETSGPLSFMDVYDKMCFTVSSAGGRRGAQMGTMRVDHPDIQDFITAKREDGRLRQFNLSVLITRKFINAVKNDEDWNLIFPLLPKEGKVPEDQLVHDELGNKHRIYKTLKARKLWDLIMASTYDYAEPGFLLIDQINDYNPLFYCEEILATNPCGEQPLPPYGACLLGSLNLTAFVKNPFTDRAYFDWDKFKESIHTFSRMLDNVVEVNNLPLPEQQAELERKRRHGMGFLGLGSTLTLLTIPYGSEKSVEFTSEVSKTLAIEGFRTGLALAQEKGPAPIMNESFEVLHSSTLYKKLKKLAPDFLNSKSDSDLASVPGRILWANSPYIQKIKKVDPTLWHDLLVHGCRYSHCGSIAPTGTISLSLGNNACISKGSMVDTLEGSKPIEKITLKDKVKSYNSKTDLFKYKSIKFSGKTRSDTEVYLIVLDNGKELKLTFDHEVQVLNLKNNKIEYVELIKLLKHMNNYEVVCDE